MLTSAKLTEGYLVVEIIRELDKEPSLHFFSILQIRYLLVVILELKSVSEVQYKGMMTER